MNEKIETACCFTGHRFIPEDIKASLVERLRNGVDYLYTHMNIKTFYAGGALGFDSLAAEAVIDSRKVRPDIRLVIVVPCKDQDKKWGIKDKIRYYQIKRAANDVICLSDHYYQGCMHQRNRFLVDHSAACICYLTKDTGGTAYTVGYAQNKGLKIFNLARPKGTATRFFQITKIFG